MLGGVYSCDTLPLAQHYEPTLYIVNTAKSSHPTGKHWIAMLVGISIPEYFDSLGQKPRKDFVDFLGPNYMYCSTRLQSLDLPSCGYYCLHYALCRAQHMPFERIVQDMYVSDDYGIMQTVQQIRSLA